MKKFEAIIFDMDGVIVDSEPWHERAFLELFQELGYGETHGISFPEYYGRSDIALWRDFVAKHQLKEPIEQLAARKQQRLIDILRAEEPIFETLPELLAKLSNCYRLASASSSYHAVIDAVLAIPALP